ncbi:MAG: Gfo/Idh/MocA family oxidoreductase [Gammaproteobacteria bacterium]|nr:Gfo/Idh/MocA family oxidoreductase [Gammaproteobacteria bacterium]
MIKWGILGCGDVAEVKSGPAFQKAKHSELIAVMRRNATKAKDFAQRHGVEHWYDNVDELLANPDVNAIYVASPPIFHEEHAIKAMQSGKHVYLEKPMAVDADACRRIAAVAEQSQQKLSIAHYRRALPAFIEIGELLRQGQIGRPLFADIKILQPQTSDIIAQSELNWRTNPAVSGGGLFHDVAPHQLDLMLRYFGRVNSATGAASNQLQLNSADDTVSANLHFDSGVQVQGLWCFGVTTNESQDRCKIVGTEGSIEFSFFGDQVTLLRQKQGQEVMYFENPKNIQLPMIEQVIQYFMHQSNNPCSADEATAVIELMDICTK